MSDDWNFHDAVEDGIRDNAGHLALAGALMAHSQRQKQLQALEASRQHQAQIAKTEAQRLDVEKQRLELERLKQQAEKEEKEAVRLLRVMMAEVGAEFDGLSSRGQLKGSSQGVRRDYAMAVLLSKLALIRSRSNSLSDLNDLKELSRLENASQELLEQHFSGRDPQQIARNKWREIETWMATTDRFEEEVKKACGVVPDPTAVQLPSKADLAEKRRQLEGFLAQLPERLAAHAGRLPVDAAVDGCLYSELAEQAQLEDLRDGKQASRAMAFANRWRMVATVKRPLEPGMLVMTEFQPELVVTVQGALTRLGDWQNRGVAHERELRELDAALDEGRLQDAEASAKKLGGVKFAELNYQPTARLQELRKELEALAKANGGAAARAASAIRVRYPKAGPQSELLHLLQLHQKRAKGEKHKALITALVMFGLLAAGAKLALEEDRENQRAAAILKIKAEEERKEWDRQMALAEASKVSFLSSNGGDMINLAPTAKIQVVFMKPGTFAMGHGYETFRPSDLSPSVVTLRQPFWIAKTELTQTQWESVMNKNPSEHIGSNRPVNNVSWEDAQACIDKLNNKRILPDGWIFALPTEAQWEYACRAGDSRPYSGGSLNEVGWYEENSVNIIRDVATKNPNAWGLYDMHGNVEEWCSDRNEIMPQGGGHQPTPSVRDYHVSRGGRYSSAAIDCRAASRNEHTFSVNVDYGVGLRLAIVRAQ